MGSEFRKLLRAMITRRFQWTRCIEDVAPGYEVSKKYFTRQKLPASFALCYFIMRFLLTYIYGIYIMYDIYSSLSTETGCDTRSRLLCGTRARTPWPRAKYCPNPSNVGCAGIGMPTDLM